MAYPKAQQRVFISSVLAGFESERRAARMAVESLRQQPIMAEDFGAKPHSAQVACLDGVRSSQIYVGILGERYGTVVRSGVSATEEEFLEAQKRGLRILVFVQDTRRDPEQSAFLERIKGFEDGYHLDFFENPEELTTKIVRALFDEIGQPNVALLDVAAACDLFEHHGWGSQRKSGTSTWLGAMFVPSRYGEEYISVLSLGDATVQDGFLQRALFGTGAFFRKDLGAIHRDGPTHLLLGQEDDHRQPSTSLEVWTDGTLVCGAAVGGERRSFGLVASFVINQDEVQRLLAAFCAYATGFYADLDRGALIASLYVGLSLSGVEHKSFGRVPAVDPGHITMPMANLTDPMMVPTQPLKIARAELANATELARSLTEMTARTFRVASAYYEPRG